MIKNVSFDDVWRMFQETDRKFREMSAETDRKIQETGQQIKEVSAQMQETDRRMQETDRQMQETDRRMKETDRRMKETDRRMKETDRRMKETDRQMQETDRQMQETDRQMQETDRKVKEVSRQIGQLGGRLGEFVEGLVAPACEILFAERGIPVHKVSRQVKAKLPGGRHMEIDLFVVNTDAVSLVEVKSKLTIEDVQDHVIQMVDFKEFFPEYANKKAIGAVAGMVVDENVIRFAIKKGLFVMVQAGDSVRMANDKAFVPHTW